MCALKLLNTWYLILVDDWIESFYSSSCYISVHQIGRLVHRTPQRFVKTRRGPNTAEIFSDTEVCCARDPELASVTPRCGYHTQGSDYLRFLFRAAEEREKRRAERGHRCGPSMHLPLYPPCSGAACFLFPFLVSPLVRLLAKLHRITAYVRRSTAAKARLNEAQRYLKLT